jgi:hypothetical protein
LAWIVLGNLLLAGLVGRYVVLGAQWKQRDYGVVDRGVAKFVPPGSMVAGDPGVWYAVEKVGAVLGSLNVGRTDGGYLEMPDPRKFTYVIRKVTGQGIESPPPGYHKMGEFGEKLPPALGNSLATADYRMNVYESNLSRRSD